MVVLQRVVVVVLYRAIVVVLQRVIVVVFQRVMPSLLFILLRFYLRVDDVLVRTNDTRYFHEIGTDHMLREFTSKESRIADLKVGEMATFCFCVQ